MVSCIECGGWGKLSKDKQLVCINPTCTCKYSPFVHYNTPYISIVPLYTIIHLT